MDRLRLVVKDVTPNATFVAFNQTLDGIDVFNGQVKFTMTPAGEVVQASAGDVVPDLNVTTRARLSPEEAVRAGLTFTGAGNPGKLTPATRANDKTAFLNPAGRRFMPISAELTILPMDAATARLAWRIFIEVDAQNSYEVLVDSENGSLLFRHRLNLSVAQARVWTQSPMVGARELVTFPEAWLPAGATETTGNNVDAYLDATGDDKPDATNITGMVGGRASSSVQFFDFPFGDGVGGQDPRNFKPASVTNLFYYVNYAHDFYYGLGFTESAGNFQTDNFGRGGAGNDPVLAEAQQGGATNNAGFLSTPDGTSPRLRVGIFTRGTSSLTDDLDAVYDSQILIHEYGHGVSNRLVGGRTSTSCLAKIQSGAMGEGWSDYFAASQSNNPVVGAYTTQNTTTGIRRQSYEGYTFTYEDLGNGPSGYEVHDDGEIWAATLWDLRKSLGSSVTDLLVINGLKSTPCNPSMTDARDAILSADQAAGGFNRTAIWQVFARHGMGYSAAGLDGNAQMGTIYNAAYDQPPGLQPAMNPRINSQPFQSLKQGGLYSYQVTATNPANGTLLYALTQGPAGMTTDSSSGQTQWTAAFTSQRVKITVTDGKGGRVVHGFLLPVETPLTPGTPLIIAGAQGETGYADVTVPAGTPVLQVTLRGGTGDTDMLLMTPNNQLAGISARSGNTETLSIAAPPSGRWQIQISGFKTFANVALTASFVTPQLLPANTTINGLSGVAGAESFYRVHIPPGTNALTVATSGGLGDVDLYLRVGAPAACQSTPDALEVCFYDSRSIKQGNNESIVLVNPAAGEYYFDLSSVADYSGVTLTTTVVPPPVSDTPVSFGVAGLSPPATSGNTQTLTFTFNAPDGFQTLEVLNVLINTALDGRQACYLAYSRPANSLFIVANSGDATQLTGKVMDGTGTVGNGQCTVSLAGSSATGSGTTFTLALNLSFDPSFSGNKVVYAAARDVSTHNTGWQVMGVHAVPGGATSFPNPSGMNPPWGNTLSQSITFTYQDLSNATNLQTVWALINTSIDGRGACYVAYYRPGNQLFLYPDSGDGTQATSIALSGNNTIGNSQCTISAQGAGVQANGDTLTLTLPITFKTAFAGFKGAWIAAQTLSGTVSPWQALGAWAVPAQ